MNVLGILIFILFTSRQTNTAYSEQSLYPISKNAANLEAYKKATKFNAA